jgi:hypothetical protein
LARRLQKRDKPLRSVRPGIIMLPEMTRQAASVSYHAIRILKDKPSRVLEGACCTFEHHPQAQFQAVGCRYDFVSRIIFGSKICIDNHVLEICPGSEYDKQLGKLSLVVSFVPGKENWTRRLVKYNVALTRVQGISLQSKSKHLELNKKAVNGKFEVP